MDDVRALVDKQNRDLERIQELQHRRAPSAASSVLTEINDALGGRMDDDDALSLSRWEHDKQRWNKQLADLESKLAAAAGGTPLPLSSSSPSPSPTRQQQPQKKRQWPERDGNDDAGMVPQLEAELSRVVDTLVQERSAIDVLEARHAQQLQEVRERADRDREVWARRERALEQELTRERARCAELQQTVATMRVEVEEARAEARRLRLVSEQLSSTTRHTQAERDHDNNNNNDDEEEEDEDQEEEQRLKEGYAGALNSSAALLDRWQTEVEQWKRRFDTMKSRTALQDQLVASLHEQQEQHGSHTDTDSESESESVRLSPPPPPPILKKRPHRSDKKARRRTVQGAFRPRRHHRGHKEDKTPRKKPSTRRLSVPVPRPEPLSPSSSDGERGGALNKSNIDVHLQLSMDEAAVHRMAEERVKDALAQQIKAALLERIDWLSQAPAATNSGKGKQARRASSRGVRRRRSVAVGRKARKKKQRPRPLPGVWR